MNKIKILFVCAENVCRSPMAQTIFKFHLKNAGLHKQVKVASAGTLVSQPGIKPDRRAANVCKKNGIKLPGLKARRIQEADFVEFDRLLVMEHAHLEKLLAICPETQTHKIGLLSQYAQNNFALDIPDPYFASNTVFENVFDQINDACEGLVHSLVSERGL